MSALARESCVQSRFLCLFLYAHTRFVRRARVCTSMICVAVLYSVKTICACLQRGHNLCVRLFHISTGRLFVLTFVYSTSGHTRVVINLYSSLRAPPVTIIDLRSPLCAAPMSIPLCSRLCAALNNLIIAYTNCVVQVKNNYCV